MAPLPVPLHIQNLTRHHLQLLNASHPFLDPLSLPPSSKTSDEGGPSVLAYLPPASAASLDLVFTVQGSRDAKEYRVSLSKKSKATSWSKSRWEKLDAIIDTSKEGDRPSSSTSERTLDGSTRPGLDLSFFRVKDPDRSHRLLILSTPPLDSWMSLLPDTTSLGDILVPGTHQSTALYGWPVSQCQQPSTALDVQLKEGIRFLDVRLAEKNGQLIAYHGILTQRALFPHLLSLLTTFLSLPSSSNETILLSIQQENASTPLFLSLLREALFESPDSPPRSLYHLSNTIPRLGDVRGKIVLFSRFGGQEGSGWEDLGGMGIHPTGWRDSVQEGFEVQLPEGKGGEEERNRWGERGEGGWVLGIQDWYNIHTVLSIPEKTYAVQSRLLIESPKEKHVALAFCSASAFPLACPVYVARGFGFGRGWFGVEGVNGRMGRWLASRLAAVSSSQTRRVGGEDEKKGEGSERLNGWVLLDFYRSEPGLVELLLAFNFL